MSSSSSSQWSSHEGDVMGPEEKNWAFQLILEDQQEGLEAFRRRHERRQRRLERDLRQIQRLEAAVANDPTQKWKEMEKLQLQEEMLLREQQHQRKEEEIFKQQLQQQQQQQLPLAEQQHSKPARALSSLLYPSRTNSLYPSTLDMATTDPQPTPPLQRHRSESWVITSRSSASFSSNDPSSPFVPQPTRPVGWSIVDDEGCLVMETSSPVSSQSAVFPSSTITHLQQHYQQQQEEEEQQQHGRTASAPTAPPRMTRPGRRRPGGPDLCSDDGVTQARHRGGSDTAQPRLPSSPRQPSRSLSHTNLKPSRAPVSPPLQRRSLPPTSPSQQERMYRKIVPIFPQVPAERIMQLVREQQQQQLQQNSTSDDDDDDIEERLLSTILSILAEESIPLAEEELADLTAHSNTPATNPRECQCCYTEWSESDCPVMVPCTGSLHVFCIDCVKKYVEEVVYGNLPIPESTGNNDNDEVTWVLPCMYANTANNHTRDPAVVASSTSEDCHDLCRHGLDDLILQHVLPASLWETYQEYQVHRALLPPPSSSLQSGDGNAVGGSTTNTDQLLHCPHCNVPCLVSMSSASQTMACPSCKRESCWTTASAQPNNNATAPTSAARSSAAEATTTSATTTTSSSQLDDAGRHFVEEAMTQNLLRNCPRCLRPFVKESGCHKMKCPMCRTASCYICRQIVPWKGYTHFCTHEQCNPSDYVGCLECGPKCPLWSSEQDEAYEEEEKEEEVAEVAEQPRVPLPRPISQRRASSRTRRGLRRMDLPEVLPEPPLPTRSYSHILDMTGNDEEERLRRAAWEAAQEVWERNLLATGQEVRVNIEELVGMPPPPRAPTRQWTR